MSQDAAQIRERIISLISSNGPSLPVQIAKGTGLSILFSSAFLSELFGEKIVKISNIRVGSSPLYFLPGQEPQLERFSQYLKSKEKEAYILLKEKKILRDSEQQPAIRVALREIKDFAIPFEKNNEVFWRYFLIEEPEHVGIFEKTVEEEKEVIEEEKKPEVIEEKDIQEIKKEISSKEKPKKTKEEKKTKKVNKSEKKDDNFFNKIKDFLSKKGIEILDIKDFKNNEATLKVKNGNHEELFFAFNKKKITEKEILDANKKASEENIPYSILSLGDTSKKLGDLISAIKNLSNINKIE
jgi:outer membrane biosynthesis protein TonB